MKNINLHSLLPLLFLTSCICLLQTTDAIQYVVKNTVPNTPGGQLFEKEIGVNYTLRIMPVINRFIFRVFQQPNFSLRRRVPVLTVYISEFDGYAYKNGNNVNISATELNRSYFPRNRSKWFFTMMLIHEMTHVFQWHGNFGAPGGLTEGTADYVMVKSGVYNKTTYTKPGEGKRWDQGYGVTERFLEYCDSLLPSFTPKLNKMMRDAYSDKYWVQLLGKPVDQLWREYKAKYGNKPQVEGEEDDDKSLGTFHGLKY